MITFKVEAPKSQNISFQYYALLVYLVIAEHSKYPVLKLNFQIMAYMSLMKNLDEKAKKKELDGVFFKLDRNQNGKIFTNDFINELNDQGYDMVEDERTKLLNVTDNKGQVI